MGLAGSYQCMSYFVVSYDLSLVCRDHSIFLLVTCNNGFYAFLKIFLGYQVSALTDGS